MRNLPAVLFLALAACGGGESDNPMPDTAPAADGPPPDTDPPPPDSQVLDLSCMANQTAPTTAAMTVTVSGTANGVDVQGLAPPTIEPLDEADIEVCIDNCAGPDSLADTTSAALPCGQAGCDFTMAAIDTPNDEPIDGYLTVAKAGFRTSNIFPSEPIRADLPNVPALAMTDDAFTGISGFLGGGHTAGNGAAIVVVTDCAFQPAQGASITITQGGNAAGNTPVDIGQLVPELAGTFFVFNIPPGVTNVAASVNGTAFRAHDVRVFADEISATQVTPGFAAP